MKSCGLNIQKKTDSLAPIEITENTRRSIIAHLSGRMPGSHKYLFQSRLETLPHLSTWQYARIPEGRVASIGPNPATYGAHSLRRTNADLIYLKTGNLRTIQLRLGHTKIESLVICPGVGVNDALEISSALICESVGRQEPNMPAVQFSSQFRLISPIPSVAFLGRASQIRCGAHTGARAGSPLKSTAPHFLKTCIEFPLLSPPRSQSKLTLSKQACNGAAWSCTCAHPEHLGAYGSGPEPIEPGSCH